MLYRIYSYKPLSVKHKDYNFYVFRDREIYRRWYPKEKEEYVYDIYADDRTIKSIRL